MKMLVLISFFVVFPVQAQTPRTTSGKPAKKLLDTIPPVKEFAYEEEWPDLTDKKLIRTKEYFPLKPAAGYVFSNNNGYGELDTIICKSAHIGNQEIFYFAETEFMTSPVSIGTTNFGGGAYFYRNDSLFVIEAEYEEDLFQSEAEREFSNNEIPPPVALLPATMISGDQVTMNSEWEKQTLTYLRNESLQIGNTTYTDCIKLKLIEEDSDALFISYIWLKKEFGLVKWMRNTGRIDELVNQF